MKVLWICNIMLPMVCEYLGRESSNKEGWLTGLADTIVKNQEENKIELLHKSTRSIYVLAYDRLKSNEIYSKVIEL